MVHILELRKPKPCRGVCRRSVHFTPHGASYQRDVTLKEKITFGLARTEQTGTTESRDLWNTQTPRGEGQWGQQHKLLERGGRRRGFQAPLQKAEEESGQWLSTGDKRMYVNKSINKQQHKGSKPTAESRQGREGKGGQGQHPGECPALTPPPMITLLHMEVRGLGSHTYVQMVLPLSLPNFL